MAKFREGCWATSRFGDGWWGDVRRLRECSGVRRRSATARARTASRTCRATETLALAVLLVVVLVSSHSAARAAGQVHATASQFLASFSERSISSLTEPGLAPGEQEKRFHQLTNEGFDLPAIGIFVLGRYARGMPPEQRARFLEAFQNAMTQRFLPLFSKHPDEKLEILRERPSPGDAKSSIVSSNIVHPEGSTTKVDWRIRKRGDEFKIIDIVIEGVSMAVTLRSEYTTVIAQNGGRVDALIELLQKKVSDGTFSPDRPIKNLLQ